MKSIKSIISPALKLFAKDCKKLDKDWKTQHVIEHNGYFNLQDDNKISYMFGNRYKEITLYGALP